AYRERSHSFTVSGLGVQRSFTLVGRGEPVRLRGAAVSTDYLEALGIRALMGRLFGPAEDRPAGLAVLLLSHDFWQRTFAGDPRIIGQSLNLDDRAYTVIGILPSEFNMPFAAAVWVLLQLAADGMPLVERARPRYEFVARLRDGVAIE